jgi:hypothetical protein
MVLCYPRWLPTSGLTEFAVCWGGAGFEPRTTDLQSGALPLSHLSSIYFEYRDEENPHTYLITPEKMNMHAFSVCIFVYVTSWLNKV